MIEKKKIKIEDFNKETSVLADLQEQVKKDESDYSKVSTLLLNDKFGRRKTVILDNRQAGILTALDVIARVYDIPFLKTYIEWYTEFLTSIDARGRNDIVDISKFRFTEQQKINDRMLDLMGRGQ